MDSNQRLSGARSIDNFSTASNIFPDSQQYAVSPYDSIFGLSGESGFSEGAADWDVNHLNGFAHHPTQSRAVSQTPNPIWAQQPQHQQAITNGLHHHQQQQPHQQQQQHHQQHHHQPQQVHTASSTSSLRLNDSSAPLLHAQNTAVFNNRGAAFNNDNYASSHSFPYNQSPYDPALFDSTIAGSEIDRSTYNAFAARSLDHGSINPSKISVQAQHVLPTPESVTRIQSKSGATALSSAAISTPSAAYGAHDGRALIASIPQGNPAGLFSIVSYDDLSKATRSERFGNFVNVGREALDLSLNNITIPLYVPRKSRNELKKLVGSDSSLLAKLSRPALRKTGRRFNKELLTRTEKGVKPIGGPRAPSGQASATETSSDYDSSDDDGSSYTSDEDLEDSPLPTARSAVPREAVEYDVIRALWRSRRKSVEASSIRKALAEFWDVVKTIRDRWKADNAAVADAESKKVVGDLPLLRSRVKDSRDMIEAAFKTALKHGHRSILELFSENLALMFLCYQFLLDRFKEDDINGPLARVILEILSLCTTLTDEKVEKTHLAKVVPRFVKKGDAKTQFYAKRITMPSTTTSTPLTTGKSVKDSVAPKVEPTAGVKRALASTADTTAQKKTAVAAGKLNSTTVSSSNRAGALAKKPSDAVKTGGINSASTSVKPKTVTSKPSTFFSSLQSATKRPGTAIKSGTAVSATGGAIPKSLETPATSTTAVPAQASVKASFSFAETMANLTKPKEIIATTKPETEDISETPEEKTKRLRKEARRKLRVTFKPAEELEAIRYFTHDPDEDFGHDSNQVRDVADVGGEGRMLKEAQARMDDYDDEEEDTGPEQDPMLIPYATPSTIDFSDVDSEELKRNFYKFGGQTQPISPERTEREAYEAKTLIVFYSNNSDVPPTPKEPSGINETVVEKESTKFGLPDRIVIEKAMQRTMARNPALIRNVPPFGVNVHEVKDAGQQQNDYMQPSTLPPSVNSLPQGVTPAAPPPMNIDLQAILANLKSVIPPQTQAQNPSSIVVPGSQPPAANFMSAFGQQPSFMPSASAPAPALPVAGANIDLGAILAQLNAGPLQNGVGPFGTNLAPMPPPLHALNNSTENPDRKRLREADWDDNNGPANKRVVHHLFRTKPCKFWLEGKCVKGDNCTYVHEGTPQL